ncbi:hypothetical protein ACMGD3_06275 [Lysinibacillus sphaericus]
MNQWGIYGQLIAHHLYALSSIHLKYASYVPLMRDKVKLQCLGDFFIPQVLLVEPMGHLRSVDRQPFVHVVIYPFEVYVLLTVNAG